MGSFIAVHSLFAALRLSYPVAWKTLVPPPGVASASPCFGRQILNHWTTKEAPRLFSCLEPLSDLISECLSHLSFSWAFLSLIVTLPQALS